MSGSDVRRADEAHHVVDEQDVEAAVRGLEQGPDGDDHFNAKVSGVVTRIAAKVRAPWQLRCADRHQHTGRHQRPGPVVGVVVATGFSLLDKMTWTLFVPPAPIAPAICKPVCLSTASTR